MNRPIVWVLISVCVIGIAREALGQKLVASMTAEDIAEAIQLAADENAARQFLESYVVQSRAGWGNGPLIGIFSTPFARVVQAALAARTGGRPFTAADATPDLVAPELHVIVASEVPGRDDIFVATVRAVVITPRGNRNPSAAIQPLSTAELTKPYRDRYGVPVQGTGIIIIAIFPLGAIAEENLILVTFDRMAKGSSPMSACKECIVPFHIARLR